MEIAWEGMDTEVLRRFSQARPEEFFNAASICDNVLVMHRGVREVRLLGMRKAQTQGSNMWRLRNLYSVAPLCVVNGIITFMVLILGFAILS